MTKTIQEQISLRELRLHTWKLDGYLTLLGRSALRRVCHLRKPSSGPQSVYATGAEAA
jgi:hypothetical protein